MGSRQHGSEASRSSRTLSLQHVNANSDLPKKFSTEATTDEQSGSHNGNQQPNGHSEDRVLDGKMTYGSTLASTTPPQTADGLKPQETQDDGAERSYTRPLKFRRRPPAAPANFTATPSG
ncbi:hypothetical protein M3Y94_00019800 [Aphelenchoides besseyi]|nr:hypothetical protein M3Y94_00019800 [Aphelenchoides besseyi]